MASEFVPEYVVVVEIPYPRRIQTKTTSFATLEETAREYYGYKNYIRNNADGYHAWLKKKSEDGSYEVLEECSYEILHPSEK